MAEGLEVASKSNKKILIDVYTDWCTWCHKLDKTTFSEDHIINYIQANYIAIKFNAEQQEPIIYNGAEYKYVKAGQRGYHELAVHLLNGRLSYPSMVFLDEKQTMIQAIPGYQDTYNFEKIAAYFATNSHKSIPWMRFLDGFDRSTYYKTCKK